MPVTYAGTVEKVLGQKVGNEIFKIHPETCGNMVKLADGSTIEQKIASLTSAVSGQTTTKVVADITARDAIANPVVGDQAWVIDATGDSTVKTGGAKYIYESAEKGWIKTAEVESMDVSLDWANVENKPEVTAEQIEDAIAKAHTHDNKTDLDKLSVVNGEVAVDSVVKKTIMYAATLPDAVPDELVDGGLFIVDAGTHA